MLQYLEIGLTVVASVVAIVATAANTYLIGSTAYSVATGETLITGTKLSTEERLWAAADLVAIGLSAGSAKVLDLAEAGRLSTKAADVVEGGNSLLKVTKHADDVMDAINIGKDVVTGDVQSLVMDAGMAGLSIGVKAHNRGAETGSVKPEVVARKAESDLQSTKKTYVSFEEQMSPEDAQRYRQWNKYAEAGISPSDRVRVLEISEKAPAIKLKNGLDKKTYFEKIEAIDKDITPRPTPDKYLDPDYIEAHRRQFDNGAARFQKFKPSVDYRDGIVGGKDGTSFWLSKEHADIIQEVANGNNRIYEALLGFDPGYLGDEPLYRLDVSPEVVSEKGIAVPSGNEDGANEWWRPGGRTYPGDMPEGVMKDISTKEGDYTWKKLD